MKELFSQDANHLIPATVSLANAYASSGETRNALDIRIQLQQSGAKKKIALTSTAVNGCVSDQ